MATLKKKLLKKKWKPTKRVEKLVNRVIERILEEPRRFNMYIVGEKKKGELLNSWEPPCGTVGCLAGWAIIEDAAMNKKRAPFRWSEDEGEYLLIGTGSNNWQIKAEKLFGLPRSSEQKMDESPLFFVENWPKRFKKMYYAISFVTNDDLIVGEGRAKAGAARLRYFLKTGK